MGTIAEIVRTQRKYFCSGATMPKGFRLDMLAKLRASLEEHEERIYDALRKDLSKPAFEAYATEIGLVLAEIDYARRHLASWSRTRRITTPLMHFPTRSVAVTEPYGVALVMSPWNYPVQLTLAPLIGSIAAGNCTVVKPSAYSPATSSLLAAMLRGIFPEEYVAVVEGGREENKALLDEKFDYIFFTGSPAVGRTVMEAASKNLTPITLELGGKSPCIVDETSDIDLAARRIVWGKCINAGQTCIAPDYLLIQGSVKGAFLERAKGYLYRFYGDAPCSNPDFPRIVNEKHFQRLKGLMRSGRVVTGGESDEASLKIAPTILDGVAWDDPVMQEEIFGPLLPVMDFSRIEEVVDLLAGRPKPLALYLFTKDKARRDLILERVSFGGGCVNDTLIHPATSYMPFGGVGESGMGGYHGKASFDTFSHKKSVMMKSNLLDVAMRYPPYGDKLGLLKKIMR